MPYKPRDPSTPKPLTDDDLIDLLAQSGRVVCGPFCAVGDLLLELDASRPKVAAAFRAALATPSRDLPATVLARRLTAAGYPLPKESVQRHRRDDCSCARRDVT